MTKATWAPGYRFKVNAEIAKREIVKLKDKSNGVVNPDDLVEISKPKNAPLHDAFEWDDSICGVRYRRHQAQSMIRAVEIEYPDIGKAPAFLGVQIISGRGNVCRRGYADAVVAIQTNGNQLLTEALARLEALKNRYKMLKELTDVWTAVKNVRKK